MLAQPDKIPVVFGDAVTCSSSVHFGTLAQARLLTPEALGMSRRPSTGRSASTGIVAPAGVDQAQVRADAERAIVRYQ